MKNIKKNINIGLTREELELVINNSNNPELIKKYINKLDNCDLSKSAIELIREEDLLAVNRITDRVLSNYPTGSNNKFRSNTLLFLILLVSVLVGFLFINNETSKDIFFNENSSITELQEGEKSVQNDSNKEKTSNQEGEKIKNGDLTTDENYSKQPKQQVDSLKISDKSKKENSVDSFKINGSVLKSKKEKKKNNSSNKDKNYRRKVKLIKSVRKVPEKYKNEEYKPSDLVDFFDGNKNLENELFKGLKGKIKDDYLPRKNSSIVFKFSVTSKGKIKDLDIQSRVNIELEEIIKTTVNSLKNWTRGNKNIPVIYTVYVTFQ
ncbi:MAG: hypothetical protein CMD35_02775 [Flavobacteriales bacterium]|nr:hypothetical protein [Flavobacteriales bacterium]